MNKMPFTNEEMNEMGYSHWRLLDDGNLLAVSEMLFSNGRLFVGVNRYGYEDCYCYDNVEKAIESMNNFDPAHDIEPDGWKRHPYSGRRRENGDKKKEVVRI